eukprot:1082184-Amphidinium_carterae.1
MEEKIGCNPYRSTTSLENQQDTEDLFVQVISGTRMAKMTKYPRGCPTKSVPLCSFWWTIPFMVVSSEC